MNPTKRRRQNNDRRDAAQFPDGRPLAAGCFSAVRFLRQADYYRGDPETLLAERRRRLQAARELRKQKNIELRQRLIPWLDDKTAPYLKRQIVSL